MDNRRRGAVLAACGAAVIAASSAFAGHMGGVAGLSSDFWQGVPLGMSLVLIVVALVLLARLGRPYS